MTLASDIRALERDTVAGLDASLDYYEHTKAIWRIFPENYLRKSLQTIKKVIQDVANAAARKAE